MPLLNHQIKATEVRVVLADGTSRIMRCSEALHQAQATGQDLICLNSTAVPPVCRIQELGKWQYEQNKAQKHQKGPRLKQVQLSLNIADGDIAHKVRHAEEFLKDQNPVELVLKLSGREITKKDLGLEVVHRVLGLLTKTGRIQNPPKVEGRFIRTLLAPVANR